MNCTSDISKNILSTCVEQGVGGNEEKCWVGQRRDFDFTYDVTNPSKVTGITPVVGKLIYTATVSKKALDSGFDRLVEAGRADRFTHMVGLTINEFDAASKENIDSLSDVFVVVEARDKGVGGDGTFRGFGLKYGLDVTADTMRANTASGGRPIELAPNAGDSEPWSFYTILATDYATTLALLEGLETLPA